MATLKRIDPISVPAVENSLGIFDILPTSVAFNRTHVRELLPLMTVTREGPYTFRLFSDSQFVDFSKTWLWLSSSLEKKDGANWVKVADSTDDKNTSVTQNYGQSFVRQLKITINGIDVYNNLYYPFSSYISSEFGQAMNVKKGMAQASLYFPDDGEKGQEDSSAAGFKERAKAFAGGKTFTTMSLLNFDLAQQNNLFLNNSDIVFTIWPQKDNFLILAPTYDNAPAPKKENNTEYRIKIHEVKLFCTLVDVVQSLQNQIARQLEITPAKYPLRKIELRHLFLPNGTTNIAWNVFTSVIPRRLMVFFIDNDAYDGVKNKSPFNFKHASVENIWVEANNIKVPDNPYILDFEKNENSFVRSFTDFYDGLDHINQETAIELTLAKYKNGWTGFVFPLSASWRDAGDSFELIKNGTTVIKAHLKKAVEDTGIIMLAMGEFDEVLTINADRVLSVDGSI
jgi:hypothetical protein